MKSKILVSSMYLLMLFSVYGVVFASGGNSRILAQQDSMSTYTSSTTGATTSSSTIDNSIDDQNYNDQNVTPVANESASTSGAFDFFGIGSWFWLVVLVLLIVAIVVLYMQ
jgi:peptidoglycan hydrolase CwlO-like protein